MQNNFPLSFWQSHDEIFLIFIKSGVFVALGIFFAFFINKKIKEFFLHRDELLGNFIAKIVWIILLSLSSIMALGTLGIQTNSIIALFGTAGLAIALGLKNSLSSLASGIIIVILRPFKKNDLIEIGAISGRVVDVNLFHTTLQITDHAQAVIPNESLAKSTLINHSNLSKKKLTWEISLVSDEKIATIKTNLLKALHSHSITYKTPEVSIHILSCDHQNFIFKLEFWIDHQDSQDDLLQTFLNSLQIPISTIKISN